MFDHNSRYAGIEEALFTTPDGRRIVYCRRRLLPLLAGGTLLAEHSLREGERLDVITARYLGDPRLFWQLCDVNPVLHPGELTETPGRKIKIALL